MSKIIGCIIARTVSTRLPLKVLRDISPNINMLEFLINRLKKVSKIDELYLCTSKEPQDDILEDIAIRTGIKIYRGSSDEVTERMIAVGNKENADVILRITGDNPLTSYEYIDKQIDFLITQKLDYVRLVNVPIGSTAEVIKFDALKDCHKNMDPSISEYLMLFLFNPEKYKCGIIEVFKEDFSNFSITVDTKNDLTRVRKIVENYGGEAKLNISLKEILNIYLSNIEDKSVGSNLNTKVKMPYNKIISLNEFYSDMNERKKKSFKLELHE